MDLTFSSEDLARVSAVGRAVSGPSLAGQFDSAAWDALRRIGSNGDRLAVVAVVSEASRLGALTPIGAASLVLPLFGNFEGVVAIADAANPDGAPTPYGADADLMVRYEGQTASLYRADPAAARRPPSQYVYPLGVAAKPTGARLATAPASAVMRRRRVGIAAEAVGAMDSVLASLAAYVTRRRQFGQPLGALQAVQHRLAELAIDLEMARWLTREAAWDDRDASAALAAAYAARRARRFAWEVHQLSGARGFTLELGLSHDTLRLQALSIEAGGAKAHEAAAYSETWAVAA